MSPNRAIFLLTEIVAAGTGDILRSGLLSGLFSVGGQVGVYGRMRTILKMDKREHRSSCGGVPYTYQVLYVS
jgi:hypothetical protein